MRGNGRFYAPRTLLLSEANLQSQQVLTSLLRFSRSYECQCDRTTTRLPIAGAANLFQAGSGSRRGRMRRQSSSGMEDLGVGLNYVPYQASVEAEGLWN